MIIMSSIYEWGVFQLIKEIKEICRYGLQGEEVIVKDLYDKHHYIIVADKEGDSEESNQIDVIGVNSLKNVPKVPYLVWNTKTARKVEFTTEINIRKRPVVFQGVHALFSQ